MTKKILYIHDFQVAVDKNGFIYTAVGLPPKYFDRFFLSGASNVSLLSRVKYIKDTEEIQSGYIKIDNPKITLASPELNSYLNFFKLSVLRNIAYCCSTSKLVVFNFPTILSLLVYVFFIIGRNIKYSCEVAANYDQYSTKGILGITLSQAFKLIGKKILKNASGAIYVSKYLQDIFPTTNAAFASNVELDDEILPNEHKKLNQNTEINILYCGGLTKRKGVDVIIRAASIIKKSINRDLAINFYLLGGHSDFDLENLIEVHGVKNIVHIVGIVSKELVYEYMNKAHIYLQPSVTEGLPRATIEAMAHGLPVIATKIPAFNSLIDHDLLFDVDNHVALADLVRKLIFDEKKYTNASRRNFNFAQDFNRDILMRTRTQFYTPLLA